jgi:uncharacterized protein YegP (UPF0339 family)
MDIKKMSQAYKADDYNLTQPSRLGRAGFESFKNDKDGRFYFHFNDTQGVALLFSQAYRREVDRDKGVLSVVRNAVVEDRFGPQNTEGGYFFALRAANKQEIARSRVFSTMVELEKQRTFFRKNLSLSADNEDATVPADLEQKEVSEDPLRQVFRIEIYKNSTNERIHGQIIHPFSDDVQTFNGLDLETIRAFMAAKMQTYSPMVAHSASENNMLPPKPAPQMSPVSVLNLNDKSTTLRANQPFALALTSLPNEREGVTVGQNCFVEIQAFNLESRERVKIMEKTSKIAVFTEGVVGVRVEPLVLAVGGYRLSIIVSLSADKTNDKQTWQGGIILQIL